MMYMIGNISRNFNRMLLDKVGTSAIEFALLLPVFIVLVLGVIEFGMYFVQSEIASNAINTVEQNLQRNAGFYSGMTPAQLTQTEKSLGSGLVSFTKPGNYLCVTSYTTAAAASSAPPCTSTTLNAGPPVGFPAGSAYYVAVRADLNNVSSFTPLGNFVSQIKKIKVADTSGSVEVNSLSTPKACTKDGYFLQYDPTKNPPWQCVPIGQIKGVDCTQPWQKMAFDGTTFSCVNVPYVFAGGVENPSTSNGGFWGKVGGVVNNDHAGVPWITGAPAPTAPQLDRTTLCKQIKFKVPAISIAGKIVAQGNLIYPTNVPAGGDGNWHSWSASFVYLDTGPTPPTASVYDGSAYLCIANSGNWIVNDTPATVASERISWTIIFIPN